MKARYTPTTIHEAAGLPFAPRIERLDFPPANPRFRTVYGAEIKNHGRDDLAAFEEHGRNLRHAAECAGLLETSIG